LKWDRKAADLGEIGAMLSRAAMYAVGQGVEKGKHLWLAWIRQAADGGDAHAKEILKKRGER
jgi:TPR repeat protein